MDERIKRIDDLIKWYEERIARNEKLEQEAHIIGNTKMCEQHIEILEEMRAQWRRIYGE